MVNILPFLAGMVCCFVHVTADDASDVAGASINPVLEETAESQLPNFSPATEEANRDLGKKHGGGGGVGSSWYGPSPMFYGPAPMYAAPMYSAPMYSTPMWGNSWGGRFLAEEMPTPEEMEVRAEIAAIPLSPFEQRLLKKKSRGSGGSGAASWGPSYSSYGPSYYAPSYYSYPQQSYPMYGNMWGYRRFLARGDTSADISDDLNEAETANVPAFMRKLQHDHHHHHHGGSMGMGYGHSGGPYGGGMYGNGNTYGRPYGGGMYGSPYGGRMYGNGGMYGNGMYGNGGMYGGTSAIGNLVGQVSRFLREDHQNY